MSRGYLVLDIETIPDRELYTPPEVPAGVERPFPPLWAHRPVVIGVLWLDEKYAWKRLGVVGEGKDEAGMLADFSAFVERERPHLVSYNGRGFDMPVIATRCLRHGIPIGHYYQSRDVRYRFSPDGHLDLMDYVADFGAAKPSRLDIVAKLCGMPGKVGVDGKDVGPMVHAGRIQEVKNYCLCDVVQTAGVFLRVQLLRGVLDREHYVEAMRGLIAAIRADARLTPVASALNEARLMLNEAPT